MRRPEGQVPRGGRLRPDDEPVHNPIGEGADDRSRRGGGRLPAAGGSTPDRAGAESRAAAGPVLGAALARRCRRGAGGPDSSVWFGSRRYRPLHVLGDGTVSGDRSDLPGGVGTFAFAEDGRGRITIAGANALFHFADGRFIRQPLQERGDRRLAELHVDADGRVWLGTDRVLWVMNGQLSPHPEMPAADSSSWPPSSRGTALNGGMRKAMPATTPASSKESETRPSFATSDA